MVFDDHMRASARVLAHHFMMNGGGVDDITGGDRGRGHPRARAGLEEIGLFRQSLVRDSKALFWHFQESGFFRIGRL